MLDILDLIILYDMQEIRLYEKKKQTVAKFIRKHAKVDHSVILNEVNIDYGTLMKIIS